MGLPGWRYSLRVQTQKTGTPSIRKAYPAILRFPTILVAPLVESTCKGLKTGFWPWAITVNSSAPSIVDNATLQKVRNPDHLQFMREQRDEEIRLGRFSEAFATLSPGMTTIPLWVIPKPHSDKSCLVVDHSAGDTHLIHLSCPTKLVSILTHFMSWGKPC